MKRALMVVAKRPKPGQTKTRLSPPLSADQASGLYQCFLEDTLDLARAVPDAARILAFAPRDEASFFGGLAPDFTLIPQVGRDLGERLDNALACCFGEGFSRSVVVGSDSPTLLAAHIARAFDLLEEADVVLGPCDDGGYYLVGLKRPQPGLLRRVRMSTPTVLRDTLALAKREGLRVALVPPCYDVDTVEDLMRLQIELKQTPGEIASHTRRFLRDLRWVP